MSTEAMILVLSDLHFGRDFYNSSPQIPLIRPAKLVGAVLKDAAITKFFEEKCKQHDAACLKVLPLYLNNLLAQADWEAQADQKEFDLCILLGDQATIPDSDAYNFLRKYLTEFVYETSDGYIEYRCPGLGLKKERILAIPGNHDKLLLTNLDFYNGEFTKKIALPEEVEVQRCAVTARRIGKRELIFVLADANKYAKQQLDLGWSALRHLAGGEITRGLENDIVTKLEALRERVRVGEEPNCSSFENAFKILLIHYPVDYRRFQASLLKKLLERGLQHDCKGLAALVERLHSEFKLNAVLHGHLHQAMLYNHEGVQVVAATTSSQSGGKIGFYVLKISDTGQLSTEHHSWNGGGFVVDPPGSPLNHLIGNIPASVVPQEHKTGRAKESKVG